MGRSRSSNRDSRGPTMPGFPGLVTLFLLFAIPWTCVIVGAVYVGWIGDFVLLLFAPIAVLITLAALNSPRMEPDKPDQHKGDDSTPVDESEPSEGKRFAGIWNGTARFWPTTTDSVLRVLPIRLTFSEDPLQARLIRSKVRDGRERIVAVEVLEHDATNDDLDLRVMVEKGNRSEEFVAKLQWESGVLLPADESDPFTLELRNIAPPRQTQLAHQDAPCELVTTVPRSTP